MSRKIFEYSKIGSMGMRNRIVMSPMGTQSNVTFQVDDRMTDYYEARAKGGVGMIILEGQPVTSEVSGYGQGTNAGTILQMREWERFVTRLKGYGAKLCVQLAVGPGRNMGMKGARGASAVPVFGNPDVLCDPLTIEEIQINVRAFHKAAQVAKAVGFDAIEIHGHTGYLLDNFMSECWNKREDEYGGSFENRMRFTKELIEAVREAVGPDFPILFRMALEHRFPGGRTTEEGLEIVRAVDSYGVDAIDIDTGSYETIGWMFPPAYYGDACLLDSAKAAKSVTDKPILVTGSFTPETAQKAVEDGSADYVMFGRPLIADPELPNKMKAGTPEKVRPCLRCNQYCVGRIFQGYEVTCAVNAQADNEKTYPIRKTDDPKNVVVIGGGPAGLEAARVAAISGHQVTLYEKSAFLGGQAAAAAQASFKTQLRKFIAWEEAECKDAGVVLKTNCEMTPDSPELTEADVIILALGAKSFVPGISGIDKESVIDVMEAHHLDESVLGRKIVVAGGGLSGCDFAVDMAMEGKEVTIVEMLPELAMKENHINRNALLDVLPQYNVNMMTNTKVLEITDDGVWVEEESGEKQFLQADTVVTAFGTKSCRMETEAFLEKYPDCKCIGDCVDIGQVGSAVRAGFFAAWTI